jgi:16S rRNA G966 N2-methylase RsmD
VFVDDSPAAVRVIHGNAQSTGLAERCRVVRADAAGFLVRSRPVFDLILMDPPFASGAWPGILEQAAAAAAPGALLLCESAAGAPLPERAAGLRLEKCYRYGAVQVARYKNSGDGEPPASEE